MVIQNLNQIYEFRGRLFKLHQLKWIDNRTRAIIIQLNLYNPNVELFTSINFLIEFLSTGGINSQVRFEPMNFYGKFFFFKENHLLLF